MKKQGKYRIIEQRPDKKKGGTIVRYITGYGEEAVLDTFSETPEDIRKSIEKWEAREYGSKNPSPESIVAWSSPGLLKKMN